MNTILQVISDTNIGGGGRSLLNYLSCQDRSQFQSQVVLPRGQRPERTCRGAGGAGP